MFEARRQSMKAFMVAERLLVNGVSYTVKTVHKLCESMDLKKVCIKQVTENITAFYGSLCWMSNYSFAPFTDKHGVCYHSSEQYLHHKKAILFNDNTTANKILQAKTPQECKTLGRETENFVFNRWRNHCEEIMKEGLHLKFTQNKACFQALEDTGNTRLVEASPTDQLWGAGLAIDDDRLKNSKKWLGDDLMGNVLEEICSELISGQIPKRDVLATKSPTEPVSGLATTESKG